MQLRSRSLALGASLLTLAAAPARGQDAFALGGPARDQVLALARGADGATFVAGEFRDAFDADPGPDARTLTAAGEADGFLAAYDAAGAVRWAFPLGGAQSDAALGLALGDGAVFVTGRVNGAVDFDPGPGTHVLETTAGTDDVFVAAYDAATGALRWATVIGTLGEFDEGLALAFGNGTLYATGAVHGYADVDPRPDVELLIGSEVGQQDVYLVAFQPDGTPVGGFTVMSEGLVGGSFDAGYGLAVSGAHVLLTGSFSRLADFDPSENKAFLFGSQAGYPSAFLASYTLDGRFEWAHEFNGGDFPDGGTSVVADAAGNVYAAGFFNDAVDFDPGPGEALFAAEVQDGYVVSFTPEGTFRWAFALQSPAFENVNALAIGPEGHLYVGGSFAESVDFDPGPGQHVLTATAFDDLFVASYTLDGGLRWAFGAGAPPAPGFYPGNFTTALVAGPGFVTAGGSFEGTVDFAPGAPTLPLTAAGDRDGFVARYPADGVVVGAEPGGPAAGGPLALSVPAPTPTSGTARLTLTAAEAGPVSVELLDALGRRLALLHDGTVAAGHPLVLAVDAAALAPGLYVVRAADARGHVATRRLVVAR